MRSQLAAPFPACVAILIRETATTSPIPGELFVKRYGITAAECRVLMMLTNGFSPTEASENLGLSVATVKTHMSRLFQKTGTRGQSDLVRLAASAIAPAAMPPPSSAQAPAQSMLPPENRRPGTDAK